MTDQIFSLYERLILKRPLLALLVTLFVVAALALAIPQVKMDASADSLVLEGDQDLKYYRGISKRYASEDFLLVTYRPDADLMTGASLARLEALRTDLAALPGVSSVMTLLDVPLLDSPRVSISEVAGGELRTLRDPEVDLEMARQEFLTSPIYKDLILSQDGQTTALQVNLARDPHYLKLLEQRESLREQQRAGELDAEGEAKLTEVERIFRDYAYQAGERQSDLVDTVRGILGEYRSDATVYLGGVPMIAADMITFVKSDLATFGVGVLVFIVVMMAVIFRRPVWVILPLLTCVSCALLMMGLLSVLDWHMTVISSNFVALLLIITLSITIHLVVRYRELLNEHPEMPQFELVSRTMRLMAKPCIYTALTTIVAFVSLVVSGIRPVIDFGWMMTVGITVALLLAFIILPTGLLLCRRPPAVSPQSEGVAVAQYFARFSERFSGQILIAGILLTLLTLWGIKQLKVENRFIDNFHESTEIYQGMEVIDAELGGTIPLEIIIDPLPEDQQPGQSWGEAATFGEGDEAFGEDPFAEASFSDDPFADAAEDDPFGEQSAAQSQWFTRSGMSRIEAVHDYIDSLPETGKVLSLGTFYKLLKQIGGEGVDDIQLALVQRALPQEISQIMVDPYFDAANEQVRLTVRVMETSRTLRRDELLVEIRSHLINELGFAPEQVRLTGMLVLYNNMLQSLYKSQILTLGAVFVAILLMFMVLFRSFYLSLIALAPNLLAAGMVLGGMGLMGIPLDIMTVTIAAIAVGIGVDDTIHYVHRYRIEFAKDRNYLAAMHRCHGSIGRAMYYTSVTIVVGFSILVLSNFTPSIYFGLLTGAAMLAALMGALLLLPQLLVYFKPLGSEAASASEAR